jgi:hypothetical protein
MVGFILWKPVQASALGMNSAMWFITMCALWMGRFTRPLPLAFLPVEHQLSAYFKIPMLISMFAI